MEISQLMEGSAAIVTDFQVRTEVASNQSESEFQFRYVRRLDLSQTEGPVFPPDRSLSRRERSFDRETFLASLKPATDRLREHQAAWVSLRALDRDLENTIGDGLEEE
jgi:hypothetical protein